MTDVASPVGLSEHEVERWHADGYVVVEDLLDADEVAAAVEEARAHVPTREEYDRARAGSATTQTCLLCGKPMDVEHGLSWFNSVPYLGETLNEITFHPRLLAIAEQLLGTPELRLTQSLLRATYCGPETSDQQLHCDYGNNTLLVPRTDDAFGQLPTIIYLTDVTLSDAPTYVVGHRHAAGRAIVPGVRSREEDPGLYAHEEPLLVRAGSVLLYSMRTWHRGSAGTDPHGFRLVMGPVYRAAGNDWMDHTAWSNRFCNDEGRRCIERLTPRQRELIGFPPPGHPYWNAETVAGLVARYPEADPQPYLDAAAA